MLQGLQLHLRLDHLGLGQRLRQPETLTEAVVVEAEMELKALQRHALEVVDPEAES